MSEALLRDIADYCRSAGIAESTFGRLKFLLDQVRPRRGFTGAEYDLVIASQPYRARPDGVQGVGVRGRARA